MSKLTKVEIRMKTENLIGAVKKLREVKEMIVDVKNADENVYFSTPETERDEKDYHNINALDAFEDCLDDMVNDLTVMVNELIKEN